MALLALGDLQDGDPVFIDANIFIYHFGNRSAECGTFLRRCARRELVGYTATLVLAETLHRLMVAEAVAAGLVATRTAVSKLKGRPELVRQLHTHAENVARIPQMNISVLSVAPAALDASASIRRRDGLLTNDSLIVAVMNANGLHKLASTDGDFGRVPGLEVYAPTDL